MRIIRISVFALATVLGSCTVGTDNRVVEDSPVWGRADCQRGEGNLELQQEFDQAKATCLARGETPAAVAGAAGSNSCMNEQGYVLKTRAEHLAACQGSQKGNPAAASKPVPKSKRTKPAVTPEPTAAPALEKR